MVFCFPCSFSSKTVVHFAYSTIPRKKTTLVLKNYTVFCVFFKTMVVTFFASCTVTGYHSFHGKYKMVPLPINLKASKAKHID